MTSNMSTFKKSLDLLKNTNDYSTADVGRALDRALFYKTDDIECHEKALKYGFGLGELFVRIMNSLKHQFTAPDNSHGTRNLMKVTTFFWNYSDSCPDLAIELANSGAISCIMTILTKLAEQQESIWNTRQVNSLMGVLHNAIRPDECIAANRSIYRQAGAVAILQNWTDSSQMILKVKSLLILSYITNEDESEILAKNGKAVAFLVSKVKEAVAASNHYAHIGSTYFSVMELLKGLCQLIIHDTNKKIVLENEGVPVITRMLMSDFSHEEQRLATKALWSLAFDETVRKSEAIGKSLTALKELTLSEDETVRSISKRALFEIEDESSQEVTEADEGDDKDSHEGKEDDTKATNKDPQHRSQSKSIEVNDGGHVMISYNWEHQKTALKIRDELKKNGYKIWIDVDNMQGDTLECMAKAVKQADVILMCMSQHYYASTSCRQEAKYAAKKKKPMIPLIVEPGYEPDGWLDILVEANLYYKFTSDEEIRMNMTSLKNDIGTRGKSLGKSSLDEVDAPIKPKQVEVLGAAVSLQTSVFTSASTWSSERVQEWFEEVGLPQLKATLNFFKGKDLEELYKESCDTPEDFKATCEESGLKTNLDKKRLKSGLRELF
ncbi:uncharacterized protein [Amphiura filiformis]|uniref:uncharacterized protein n=1 Tax=Amphiura filiformis TaxID=82378 RepID=UPI003B21548A